MASTSEEAATVHTLLRHVLRAFYNTRQIIAYDILLKHSTLRDVHLAQMMGLTPKEVHKFLAPLVSESILHQHSKTEPKTPAELEKQRLGVHQQEQERKQRQRLFYYIDYRTAVDAVKWRMVQVTTLLGKDNQTHESQYVCPRCGSRYSTLDALSLLSPDGTSFICTNCGSSLVEETNSGVDENGEEKAKYARLMQQVDPIVRAMKAVDEVLVPENTFTIALANAIPPPDDVEAAADYPNLAPNHPLVANDMQTTTAAAGNTFKVDFSDLQEGTSADEIKKRVAQQQQNALPIWHTQSTVSGELTHAGSRQTEIQPEYVSSFSRLVEDEEKKNKDKIKADAMDAGMEDQIAAYYAAAIAKSQEDAAQFAAEDADFSEDDGNWEDSNIGGTGVSSAISTPGSATPGSAQPGPSSDTANGGQNEKPDDDDDDEDEEFEDV
jgi:transcription initiation factor TFIIE subunit alpha